VYIGNDFLGMRIGDQLMKNLIDEREKEGLLDAAILIND
jgi:L-amino acid N-acyltransferase YncA